MRAVANPSGRAKYSGYSKKSKTINKERKVLWRLRVFRIKRGGKRTTEEIVGATTHTYVDEDVTPANFPLAEAPEEERELVAFQVSDWKRDPESPEILEVLKRRGLERPTYEDALKFDEAHPDEKDILVFLHEPWQDPDRARRVLVFW